MDEREAQLTSESGWVELMKGSSSYVQPTVPEDHQPFCFACCGEWTGGDGFEFSFKLLVKTKDDAPKGCETLGGWMEWVLLSTPKKETEEASLNSKVQVGDITHQDVHATLHQADNLLHVVGRFPA